MSQTPAVAATLLFVYALVALLATVNALRPPSPPTSRLPAIWLPAMLTGELAPVWFALRILIGWSFAALGALDAPLGRLGLWMLVAAQLGLAWIMVRSWAAARAIARRHPGDGPRMSWWERLTGWPYRVPPEVEVLVDLGYAGGCTLDLYRHRDHPSPAPSLVYVHGGGWTGGDPRRASRLLLHHLARRGWVVAAIRYPLSPQATFPDHLVGVKRAIAWMKTEGAAYGVDPNRLLVAGGSAGGHLASLAALTAGEDRYQPGFEEVDTSLRGCITLYGVYDFLNRNRTRYDWPVIPRAVMKAAVNDAHDRYREASPLDRVGPHAPPFLIVHGTHDSLVPPGEAHHFVEALTRESRSEVVHLEVAGAQHAFDVLAGARVRAVVGAVTGFAERVVSDDIRASETR
jgi:acetyl esterase/lipase